MNSDKFYNLCIKDVLNNSLFRIEVALKNYLSIINNENKDKELRMEYLEKYNEYCKYFPMLSDLISKVINLQFSTSSQFYNFIIIQDYSKDFQDFIMSIVDREHNEDLKERKRELAD